MRAMNTFLNSMDNVYSIDAHYALPLNIQAGIKALVGLSIEYA